MFFKTGLLQVSRFFSQVTLDLGTFLGILDLGTFLGIMDLGTFLGILGRGTFLGIIGFHVYFRNIFIQLPSFSLVLPPSPTIMGW